MPHVVDHQLQKLRKHSHIFFSVSNTLLC